MVGCEATVRVDDEQRRATEVAELLQPAGSIPLCVVQQLVGLRQLVLRDATEPGQPRCDVGHGEVGDDGQLLVERVLDLHGQTTRIAEQPLQSGQAGVLPGAEVEQAEDLRLEPVPTILPVADDPLGGLPCLGKAAGHTAHVVVEQAGGEVVVAQVARGGEAADVVRVLPGLKRMDLRDNILHGEHRRPASADVLAGVVDPVPCGLVAELDPEAVECALDGVPHPVDDADVQGCGEVRQVLLDRLRLGQATDIHAGVDGLLHARAALVDVEHQLVELGLRDEAAQADVADGLVGEHEAKLLLRLQPVREDDDLVVAEGVPACWGAVEVALRPRRCGPLVQTGVGSLEVGLAAEDVDLGLDHQLGQEVRQHHPHTTKIQRLRDGLAVDVDEVASGFTLTFRANEVVEGVDRVGLGRLVGSFLLLEHSLAAGSLLLGGLRLGHHAHDLVHRDGVWVAGGVEERADLGGIQVQVQHLGVQGLQLPLPLLDQTLRVRHRGRVDVRDQPQELGQRAVLRVRLGVLLG